MRYAVLCPALCLAIFEPSGVVRGFEDKREWSPEMTGKGVEGEMQKNSGCGMG